MIQRHRNIRLLILTMTHF